MGTRNLTCVFYNGEYKVAQYGQWDGYPGGQGLTILEFLRNNNMDKFKKSLKNIRFLTDDEYKKIIEEYTDNGSIKCGSKNEEENLWHLDRDIGAEILQHIYNDEITELYNSIDFAEDSLFCEWAYVIDLDKNTLEVFRGFNQKPLNKDERFYNGNTISTKFDYRSESYYPVKLLKSFNLNDLPNDKIFIRQLEVYEQEHSDTEMLEWMSFYGAQICWDNDGENCYIGWHNRDGSYRTDLFMNFREALDNAMLGEYEEL